MEIYINEGRYGTWETTEMNMLESIGRRVSPGGEKQEGAKVICHKNAY